MCVFFSIVPHLWSIYKNVTSSCVRVCGSYTDMSAGTPAEALMDFTGGVHMCVQLGSPPQNLWELMCRAGQSKSLMGCGTHEGVRTNTSHILIFIVKSTYS